MSSTYQGNAGNIVPSTSPTITIPSDGDGLVASSVATPANTLADFIAQIYAVLTGAGQAIPANQAAKFLAGGGASPVSGAINLASQNTPSAPAIGDTWFDGSLLNYRTVSSVNRQAAHRGEAFFGLAGFSGALPINGNAQLLFCTPSSTTAITVTSAVSTTRFYFPQPGLIRSGWVAFSGAIGGGGTFQMQIYKNGSPNTNSSLFSAGSTGGQGFTNPNISMLAGDYIDVGITNAAQTNNAVNCQVILSISFVNQ